MRLVASTAAGISRGSDPDWRGSGGYEQIASALRTAAQGAGMAWLDPATLPRRILDASIARADAPSATAGDMEIQTLCRAADGTISLRIKGDTAVWCVDALAAAATAVVTSGVSEQESPRSDAEPGEINNATTPRGSESPWTATGRASAQIASVGRCSPSRGLYARAYPFVPHAAGAAAAAAAIRAAADLATADPINIVSPAAVVLIRPEIDERVLASMPSIPRQSAMSQYNHLTDNRGSTSISSSSTALPSPEAPGSLFDPPRLLVLLPSLPLPAGMVALTLREWLAVPKVLPLVAAGANARAVLACMSDSGVGSRHNLP